MRTLRKIRRQAYMASISSTHLDGVPLAEHPGFGDGHLGHEVPDVGVVERQVLAVHLDLSEHGA